MAGEDRNVVMLTVDSLRYDQASEPEVMPFFSKRADESVSFTQAVANGPLTPASMPTIAASRYPSSFDGVGLPEEEGTTLAEALQSTGYSTGVWSDNPFLSSDYNFDRGYDLDRAYPPNLRDTVREMVDPDGPLHSLLRFGYLHVLEPITTRFTEGSVYRRAEELNSEVEAWLEQDGVTEPLHIWVHYMDAHHPFQPPSDWMPYDSLSTVEDRTEATHLTRELVRTDAEGATDEELTDAQALYEAECSYVDSAVSDLVGTLEEEGYLGNEDVLVLGSDHGEILYSPGEWGFLGHGNVFSEECTRVPLVLDTDLPPRTVDNPAPLIDLMPTLLDLTDRPLPPEAQGESLLPLVEGEAREDAVLYDGTADFHGIRNGRGKKLSNAESFGRDSYRVSTVGKGEKGDYGERLLDRSDREMREVMEQRFERIREEESEAVTPDEVALKDHLEVLGYR